MSTTSAWNIARARAFALRKMLRAALAGPAHTCELCGYQGRFVAGGSPLVLASTCPGCGSRPRHRLFHRLQQEVGLVPDGSEILHFAAERRLRPLIERTHPKRYVTADIKGIGFDLELDIEAIAQPDASYDVVICLHVLEHVDDRKALAELHRILRPGGRLIVMVPLVEGLDQTFEDHDIIDPAERKRHFGVDSHVRLYGRDFRERLRAAGFLLTEYAGSARDVARYGFAPGERVFVGEKTARG